MGVQIGPCGDLDTPQFRSAKQSRACRPPVPESSRAADCRRPGWFLLPSCRAPPRRRPLRARFGERPAQAGDPASASPRGSERGLGRNETAVISRRLPRRLPLHGIRNGESGRAQTAASTMPVEALAREPMIRGAAYARRMADGEGGDLDRPAAKRLKPGPGLLAAPPLPAGRGFRRLVLKIAALPCSPGR
jgi:hypothetical protein